MTAFTIQTLFLFYSALSFLSALFIGTLFWKRNDQSAKLWISGCLLTSIATALTVHRSEIPLIISYSFAVSLEALSVLIFSESLKRLSTNASNIKTGWITIVTPFALFGFIEIQKQITHGFLSPFAQGFTNFIFASVNFICLYHTQRIKKEFKNNLFFNFLSVVFGLMTILYLSRIVIFMTGYSSYSFDIKTFNVIVWFGLFLFGSIRNLAYIVLRLQLGFTEHSRLNNMNLKLSNVLDERNEMILSLQKLNRSASINALASTISHEINQPLGASRLNAQFAQIKLVSEPTNVSLLKKLIDNILNDINRASYIVKNLSKLTSNQNNSIKVVNVYESISEVIEISKSKLLSSNIEIEFNCESHLKININLSEWQQVLINLMNNAIEALDEANLKHKKIKIDVTQDPKNTSISIQDNGPGIIMGQELKIFDLMVTNKASGSGIGLWLAKNIIGRFGGDIKASNISSGGACFSIELPTTIDLPQT